MSTSHDLSSRDDDRLVGLLSHWLARHVDNRGLLNGIEEIGTARLAPGQAEAVEELAAELRSRNGRGELEMVARETLEALAHGD